MDKKYYIGIPEMDEQHVRILDLAAKAKQTGYNDLEMNNILIELLDYANVHLDQEEAFLKKNGLTDFEKTHTKKHKQFRIKAMEFYEAFREISDTVEKAKLLLEVGNFCEHWLIHHIDVEDREYAKLLEEKK